MKRKSRRLLLKHLRLSRYSSYLFMIFWQILDICIIISDSASSFQEGQNDCFTNPGNTTIFLFLINYAPNIDPSYSANIKRCARTTNHPTRCSPWFWRPSVVTCIFFSTSYWWSSPDTSKTPQHSRNPEGQNSINIPSFLIRHKTVQTTVCSLFNLGPSVQKMKPRYQQNQLHYLKKPKPNSRKFCSCWTKTLANWFKMLSRFAPSWSLWRVLFPNILRKHCILLLTLRATRSQSSEPRNISLIGFTKNKWSNREMTWRILWKQLAGRSPPWLSPK